MCWHCLCCSRYRVFDVNLPIGISCWNTVDEVLVFGQTVDFGVYMRSLERGVFLFCMGMSLACGGGAGVSDAMHDCRVEGHTCAGEFVCRLTDKGGYECVPY